MQFEIKTWSWTLKISLHQHGSEFISSKLQAAAHRSTKKKLKTLWVLDGLLSIYYSMMAYWPHKLMKVAILVIKDNVYIFRKEISRKLRWWYPFLPKISIFEKITRNMCFAIFLSNQARKNQNSKNCFWNVDLKHSFGCCVFSFFPIFADFSSFMPNKIKNLKIL